MTTEDGPYIDPEKVLLSFGSLEAPTDANATIVDDATLKFSWQPCATNSPLAHDQAMLMAYCVEAKEASYELHGAFRCLGTAELVLSPNFKGRVVQVYLAFLSADRKMQSNSVYLGGLMMN